MSAHFAGQRRAGFLQFGFHPGMAGFPHQRAATMFDDLFAEVTGAFDIKDDFRARLGR